MNQNVKEQRYRYADVFLRWNDSDDEPLELQSIALQSREQLSIAEDSERDNEIFYYCNGGYEEFLELLAFGYNTQDFQIYGIKRLY